MSSRASVMQLLAIICTCCGAQQIENGVVTVSAVGQPGAYTGFAVAAGDEIVATILLGGNGAITARTAKARGDVLRLYSLQCSPTPTLSAGSSVEVRLLPEDPYPEVSFALNMERFDRQAWEERFGEVPFHFLVCSVPGAEVFHQRGWPIGTPVVDDYIQMQAEDFGRQVVSSWSRNWTYAPPIGAYPMAIAGLWNPSRRRYVGYDFHHARLTDHTEKDFGTSYCYECGDTAQFFCLTWPYGDRYINLRYPEELPAQCGTHFRLLWSMDMGPDDDPNRFVNEFIWDRYAELLPDVERMNDLSWLPDTYRPSDFGVPGNLGSFVQNSGENPRWWEPNVHIIRGVGYYSPVDYYFDWGSADNINTLDRECRRVVTLGQWMDIEGDRCYFWRTPLDGGGAEFFGPGVETFHHVNGWYAGLALLDYYRNDPQAAADLLPHIDGVLRYTKHILYTRNGYPDVPAAQFAWSATPCVTFCLRYYYHFRDVAGHEELAALAYKLARNMTYRYLAIWPCDNDEMDDLDSSFTMEPNAGLNWLGCACANEVWVYNIAMLYEYVSTGDPIMGHYLRGMLERYHEMFQDQWLPTVQDPEGKLTERFGFYDECAQGKGVRGSFGGLWGEFERLIWPLGTAKARVVCGEKAAMCFNRDGRHTDIDQYTYYGDGNLSFKLVAGGLQADEDAQMDLTVTFPFFELQGKAVSLTRDAATMELGEDQIVQYVAESSTITLKGVKLGDVVTIGRAQGEGERLTCAIAKPRTMPAPDGDSFITRGGFKILNLARGAYDGISRDWYDIGSLAGYESGIKTLYGVPFLLLDPDMTQNMVHVPKGGIAFGEKPEHLFMLVGGLTDRSRLHLYRDDETRESVDLTGAVPAVRGWPPVMEWHIDLVMVRNEGRPILSIAPVGCQVFSITSTDTGEEDLAQTIAAIAERRDQMIAHRKTVAAMVELTPLFEAASGRVAVLPIPGQASPRSNPAVKMLHEAGLTKHVRFLTPQQLIDGRQFNSRNVWIALYVSGEDYYQTVNREGDGDEALRRWLRAGGTLVSLASGPFPFYYNESDEPVVSAPLFGLPVSGSGYDDRLDTLDVAPVRGWEKPPEGLKLTFHTNQDQEILTNLPATIPWPEEPDQRWRPIFNVVDEGNVYTPLVTLRDQDGTSYGDAAAMIEYKVGDLAGARVVYVWNSLRLGTGLERAILTDLVRHLLSNTLRPLGEYTCIRATDPPAIDGKLDDPVWQQAEPTEAFVRFDENREDGKSLKTTAKMAWDDGALYVAWECEDPDVWSAITTRDGNLWEGEVVEVYVDPDGDGKTYKEIELNPLNVVVDLNIPESVKGAPLGVEQARKWDAVQIETAVQVEGTTQDREDIDTSWTAEMAIPLRNFTTAKNLPPHVGDTWRVQLFRIERSNTLADPQFSSWSATDTFHNPDRFGRIVFATNPYEDDFSAYQPGEPPTPTWTVNSGEWQIVADELIGKNSGTSGFVPTGIVGGNTAWTDYRLRVRFQIRQVGSDHRDGAWIGFRYSGPGQCYSLNLRGGGVVLTKAYKSRASGDLNYLAQADWAADDRWHEANIVVEGNHITVALDDEPIIDVRDEEYLGVAPVPAGGICLSARRWEESTGDTVVAFDDVKVEPLR